MASGGDNTSLEVDEVIEDKVPEYFKDAIKDIGLVEYTYVGRRKVSNPTVERYIEKVAGKRMDATKTAWCAYWVGAKLEYNGFTSTKSGMARSYLKWGERVARKDIRQGDIVVLWRGRHDDGVLGHVGFYVSHTAGRIKLLGGNQGDAVSIQEFDIDKVLDVRRPKSISQSRTARAAAVEAVNSIVVKPAVEALPQVETSKATDIVGPLEKAQATLEKTTGMLDVLGEYKPYIKIALYTISAITILAIIYFRYQDHSQGKNT